MDSEHRHELQENELAAWLERKIEEIKPHGHLIIIGLVGLVLIYSAWGFYRSSSSAKDEADWDLFTRALLDRSPDLGALEVAADELESGVVSDWASITLAEGKLYEASEAWLTDRTRATDNLARAREEFDRLLLTKGVAESIRDRAQFGLARGYELEGNLKKASEAYGKVEGVFAQIAEDRAAVLGDEEQSGVFAWLQTAQAPSFNLPSGPGTPGLEPDFSPDSFGDLMDEPDDESTSDETLDDILKSYEEKAAAEKEMSEEAAEGEGDVEEETPAESAGESSAEEQTAPPAEAERPEAEESKKPSVSEE